MLIHLFVVRNNFHIVHACSKHYQDQVEDLNGVVDGLRDDLDVEKVN